MNYHITSDHHEGLSGWKIDVKLTFESDDHLVIAKNRMHFLEIGYGIIFDRFYKYPYRTVWPQPSKHQADKFVAALEKGFEQFKGFLASNRKPPRIAPTVEIPVAWNFFEQERFSHVRVVATTGSGKTTFLSALINEDLEKVKRGEASVLVLDSQNEHMSKFLPGLARFAPGGDLSGKLIYLEPDLLHPLALNIFDFTGYHKLDANEQMEMLRTVEDMLIFFIGATLGIPSGHMSNIIGYALPALVHIPDATVFTFKNLLTKGEFEKLVQLHPALKTSLDDDTYAFLATRMFGPNYGPSVAALWSRLDGITQNAFIKATFAQPHNKLNLFEILTKPHVIVIYTNSKLLGEKVTALFGRFFLAALLRVVRRRISGGLPVYVYADEAQQYIAEEEAVIDLIREARRQFVSLMLAHHRISDIKSDAVKQALEGAAVQCRPSSSHKWTIMVRNGLPVEVLPPPVDFSNSSKMPQMTGPQWDELLAHMHRFFSYEPKAKAPPPPPPPPGNNSPPPGDATTHP